GLGKGAAEDHERLHKDVAASIALAKAHGSADRERRRQRQADKELGMTFQVVRASIVNEFLKRPNSTRDSLINAVDPKGRIQVELFVEIIADDVLRTQEIGRRWVFEHPS